MIDLDTFLSVEAPNGLDYDWQHALWQALRPLTRVVGHHQVEGLYPVILPWVHSSEDVLVSTLASRFGKDVPLDGWSAARLGRGVPQPPAGDYLVGSLDLPAPDFTVRHRVILTSALFREGASGFRERLQHTLRLVRDDVAYMKVGRDRSLIDQFIVC